MDRTQRLSRILRRTASVLFCLCLLLLVISPGIVFLNGFTLDTANHLLRLLDLDGFRFQAGHVGAPLRIFIWVLVVTCFTKVDLALGAFIRLLHQVEGGTAFSQESVRLVRFLGWIQVAAVPIECLLFWILAPLTRAITGQTISSWKLAGSNSLDGLFWGGVTLLVAHILEEGFRLKTEQDLVI